MTDDELISALVDLVGPNSVETDSEALSRLGTDLHHDGPAPLVAVAPAEVNTLSATKTTSSGP